MNTLGSSAVNRYLFETDADDNAGISHDHAVFVAVDCFHAYKVSCLLADCDCLDTLGASACNTVVINQ